MILTHEYTSSKDVFSDPRITNVRRILSFVHFLQVQWACFPNDVYVKMICIQRTRVTSLFLLLMSPKLSVTPGP